MTAPGGAAWADYVDHLLVVADAGGRRTVPPPDSPRPMAPEDVERVLNDPRTLDVSGPSDHDRVAGLMTFALWLGQAPAYVPAHLRSRAARLRFLVWSAPLREDWAGRVRPQQLTWDPAGSARSRRLSRDQVAAQAVAAREDWLAHLDAWEDDPWLATRNAEDPGALEADLHWVTTTWPRGWAWRPAVEPRFLDIGPAPLGGPEGRKRLTAVVAERHWLLRGTPWAAAALTWPDRPAALLFPAVFALPAVLDLALYAAGFVAVARGFALVCALAAVLGAAALPMHVSGLALLRIPAAVAIGEGVLLSLTPRWWLSSWGWTAGLILLALALGYLALETRAHGAARRAAYERAVLLWLLGALNTFLISMVALGFVAPAVAEDGACLDGWWETAPFTARDLPNIKTCDERTEGVAPASAEVLALMTGWSLAFGLAAQILWDDRPVTAPLGRTRRGRGAL